MPPTSYADEDAFKMTTLDAKRPIAKGAGYRLANCDNLRALDHIWPSICIFSPVTAMHAPVIMKRTRPVCLRVECRKGTEATIQQTHQSRVGREVAGPFQGGAIYQADYTKDVASGLRQGRCCWKEPASGDGLKGIGSHRVHLWSCIHRLHSTFAISNLLNKCLMPHVPHS